LANQLDNWKVEDRNGYYSFYHSNGLLLENEQDLGDLVEHLPDCTGFDWMPAPKLQLREGAWYERKDGKIVGPCKVDPEQPNRYGYKWNAGCWRYRDDGKNDLCETEHLVREVEPPQPKYRPFKNAEEFRPYRNYWIKNNRCLKRVVEYSDFGVNGMSWESLLRSRTFEDGAPCGVIDQ
jgi:hypothetical protein